MRNVAGPRGEITVVSTHTVDRFPPDADGNRRSMPGGPAHYIGVALDRLGVPYRIITGPTCSVDVLPGPEGEEYLIQPIPLIPLPERLCGPAAILSPIAREIEPEQVPETDGILAIDLQGFVRHPGRPSSDLDTVDLTPLVRRAQVIKASDPELSHLSPSSLSALHTSILLMTHGAHGVSLKEGGRTHFIPSHPVQAPDTIGAGDTYLAAFIAHLLDGDDPVRAAERAARFTEEVLMERLTPPT
jgi:sugar/nucleoside kinase (ribokinase family)